MLSVLEEPARTLHEGDDFEKLADTFGPLMRAIGLVWLQCPHFNSVSDIVLLLQCVCNDLVAQVCPSALILGPDVSR